MRLRVNVMGKYLFSLCIIFQQSMKTHSAVAGRQSADQMQERQVAHRSKWSLWAKSCQSLPLALAVSKVAQILWRMDKGILKALGPV